MKTIKNIWWLFVVLPLVLNAQVRIKGTSQVRVLEEGAVRVTGNTDVESSASLSILGDFSTTGNLTNNGSPANIVVESDADQTGSLIVEGIATGDIRLERYLTPSTWHFLSPSLVGVTTNDFYFNGNPEVYASYFDEPNSTWPYLSGINESMPLGVGYKMWVAEAKTAVTAEMEGAIQTSDFSVNLSNSGSGWNLIGNPFTSEIDVRLGNWGTNTSGSFWVWDTTYNGGDYRVSNGAGEGSLDGIIPISQSFFVYATSSGNYTIPKEAQTHHETAEFYKENRSNDFVRMQMDIHGKGNTLFIGFPSLGTSGIDRRFDTYKLYSSYESPQLYGVQQGEKLCILADAPLYEQERVVPIYIDQWFTGSYSLSIDDIGAQNFDVYLEDKSANKMIHLSETKKYQFTGNSGDSQDRFLLHFSRKAQSTEDLASEDQNILVYSKHGEIYIKSMMNVPLNDGLIQIYNVNGQLIYEKQANILELYKIQTKLSSSCYLVHLNFDEVKVVKKVIIN